MIAPRALLGAVLVVASGCATTETKKQAAPAPPPVAADEGPPPESSPPGEWVTVEDGDTLWSIAARYRIAVEELVEVNGIDQPELIRAGQVIFIPQDGDQLALDVETAPPQGDLKSPRPAATVPRADAKLAWPLAEGVILRDFEPDAEVPYDGMLMAAPAGTTVHAAAEGRVVFVGEAEDRLGKTVIIRHPSGLLTIYAHLDGAQVGQGSLVETGTVVGVVGMTGRAESPQLHFQVREGRTPTDPLALLPPP